MKESRVHFACEILNIRWTKIKNNLVRMENYEMLLEAIDNAATICSYALYSY